MKDKYILQLLNEDLKGEYDAINMYNNHIEKIHNEDIKKVLIHIRDEEMEHVEELKEVMNKYNKIKMSRLKKNNNFC